MIICNVNFDFDMVSIDFSRAELPAHVVTLLNNMPAKVHPMSQFSSAITALNSESKFAKAYSDGVHKSKYWEVRIFNSKSNYIFNISETKLKYYFFQYVYEDTMDLIAKLPVVAATIYRNTYRDGKGIGAIDTNKDWSANFAQMLGYDNPEFTELMRLYLTVHR